MRVKSNYLIIFEYIGGTEKFKLRLWIIRGLYKSVKNLNIHKKGEVFYVDRAGERDVS